IVWGGTNMQKQFNTGGRYNPGTDNWTNTATTNAPERRAYHTAVWSGSEMLVWGGLNDLGPFFLDTGGKYCAQPSPTSTPTATATPVSPTPTPTATPTATPTLTPRPSPTPRFAPTPRPRATPPPRP